MRHRKIYWREDTGSFLPPLNERMLTIFFTDTLNDYISGCEDGKLLHPGEFRYRFEYEEELSDGSKRYHIRPEAASHKMHYQFFQEADEGLRLELGHWIPAGFFAAAVYTKNELYNSHRSIHRSDIPSIAAYTYQQLEEAHARIDKYLSELHSAHSLKGGKGSAELIAALGKGFTKIVDDEVKATYCDDQWWGHVDAYTIAYLESAGVIVDDAEIESITGKHFQSWTAPDEDVMQAYLDELSALSIKQLFGDKYGR